MIRNHYVPQAYLKGFSEPEAPTFVWVYDKGNGRSFRTNVTNAAVESGFYPDDVEDALNEEIEIPANAVIEKVRCQKAITPDEKLTLSLYMGVMLKRVPRHRQRQADLIPEVRERVFKELLTGLYRAKEAHPELTEAANRRIIEASRLKEEYAERLPPALVAHIQRPTVSRKLVEHIVAMSWKFGVSKGESMYLASDNPVFLFEERGIGRPESEISFPISSDIILIANWESPVQFDCEYVDARQQLVKEVNRRTVRSATRFVYYHRSESWVSTLTQKTRLQLNRIIWNPGAPNPVGRADD